MSKLIQALCRHNLTQDQIAFLLREGFTFSNGEFLFEEYDPNSFLNIKISITPECIRSCGYAGENHLQKTYRYTTFQELTDFYRIITDEIRTCLKRHTAQR